MEATAIAWACELSHTQYFALKVVTDIVDGERPSQEEFLENLGAAALSLQVAIPKVIEFCLGKKFREL